MILLTFRLVIVVGLVCMIRIFLNSMTEQVHKSVVKTLPLTIESTQSHRSLEPLENKVHDYHQLLRVKLL